ncbi:hypothetical protein MPC1_16650001 [Methylocella tundrae]|nr:hypothetical protein MPC1_16650001 [Methylocella tundrae]
MKADLDPKRFTIRTAAGLIAKSKAWADYCEGERSIDAAINKLGRSKVAA